MPIYKYLCERGHEYEYLRRMKDRHEAMECPQCDTPMTLAPSLVQLPGRERDISDMAKDSYYSPEMMNGDVERIRSMRHMENHPDRGTKHKTVKKFRDLKGGL